MAVVSFEERIEIPMDLKSLDDFRHWALSEEFPRRGRIDYLTGRIEVDMSPEDFFCHGILKTEISRVLSNRLKRTSVGYLFTDRTRVSSVVAGVSVEPDLVFVSHDSLRSGRVRFIPKTQAEPGRYAELEGAPDLIVEIVSDSSVIKDAQRLPQAYFAAGVPEYWLVDARREPLVFRIHHRGSSGYGPVSPGEDGFQQSGVFACGFRLDGQRDVQGHWTFDLREND